MKKKEVCGAPNCISGMSSCMLPLGHDGNHAMQRGSFGWSNDQILERVANLESAASRVGDGQSGWDLEKPLPMLLFCPMCRARHVDRGEFATKPHHTHACQTCGHCWRPAVAHTVGVQFLPGFKDKE